MSGPIPVGDAVGPIGVSVARGTLELKETTHKSTPAGAATPHGRGLADVKGNDRLMHIVEPTSDTPPPPCPACGSPARGSTGVQVDTNLKTCEQFFICRGGHLYSMRWPEVA